MVRREKLTRQVYVISRCKMKELRVFEERKIDSLGFRRPDLNVAFYDVTN